MANTLRFIYWQLVHLLFSNSKSPVRKGLEKRKLPSNFLEVSKFKNKGATETYTRISKPRHATK
jgi:hypothetical protein